MKANVLFIDDHSIIIDGYKNILEKLAGYDLKFNSVNNCSEAVEFLKNRGAEFDLILLDISLPPDPASNINSGEDLGIWIRKNYPQIKIIVMTMHTENFRLYNILQSLNPEGFLLKSDVTAGDLRTAVSKVLENEFYFSNSINVLLRNHIAHDLVLDSIDRSILYHISIGIKTNNLAEYIPLSLAAIEKRKKNIKDQFKIKKGSDFELIQHAKKMGFI